MPSKNSLPPAKMQQYFIKWKDGRLTASERERLQNWLASSPENRSEWEQMSTLWNLASTPIPANDRPAEILWEDLASQLKARPRVMPGPQPFFYSGTRRKIHRLVSPHSQVGFCRRGNFGDRRFAQI